MINQQLPEQRATGDGTTLDVHSIFYTIQGEGPFSGRPALFIRLAGCNLQCPGCDTNYTKHRDTKSLPEIMAVVNTTKPVQRPHPLLIVITGGEPFRQNITPLVVHLMAEGYIVQIETNGTYAPHSGFPSGAHVVCSPKSRRVASGLIPYVSAYKYVLHTDEVDPNDGLPDSILSNGIPPARPPLDFTGPIYLSPMDMGAQFVHTNTANLVSAAAQCMRFGYILNVQIHKLVGLP